MKRVTFNVAKAIKEAGYPQDRHSVGYVIEKCTDRFNVYHEGDLTDNASRMIKKISAPTYLDVWLWRLRGLYIDIAHYYNSDEVTIWDNNYNKIKSIECMEKYRDPEEVIEKAIEYLCDKNLIKYV